MKEKQSTSLVILFCMMLRVVGFTWHPCKFLMKVKACSSNCCSQTLQAFQAKFKFDSDRKLIRPSHDILNLDGTGSRLIGYWTNYYGLSVAAPEVLYQQPPNTSTQRQKLYSVTWPRDTAVLPRGWVFPNNGKPLRIGVPNRASFKQSVSDTSNSNNLGDFRIDVLFNAGLSCCLIQFHVRLC